MYPKNNQIYYNKNYFNNIIEYNDKEYDKNIIITRAPVHVNKYKYLTLQDCHIAFNLSNSVILDGIDSKIDQILNDETIKNAFDKLEGLSAINLFSDFNTYNLEKHYKYSFE